MVIAAKLAIAAVACSAILVPLFALQPALGSKEKNPNNISVKPVTRRIKLRSNQKYTGNIRILNDSSAETKVKVSAAPYWVQDESYAPVYDKYTKHTELARWISFESQEYSIKAKESVEVPYAIKAPKNLPDGGQYVAILVEFGAGADKQIDDTGVLVKGRVGTLLMADLGGNTKNDAKVVKNSVPLLSTNATISVGSLVKNSGNIDTSASYTLKIKNLFGAGACKDKHDKATEVCGKSRLSILPDTDRRATLASENISTGLYLVSQDIKTSEQTSTVTHLVLVAPLPVIIAGLCLILVILAGIVTAIVRRIRGKKTTSLKRSHLSKRKADS